MHEDPYALLDVPRTVGAAELRRAYETKLSEASRHGALKRAQALDRAYSLLRDDRKRALYDRHGVEEPLPRLHPMQRYAPPASMPFRQWSPSDLTPSRATSATACQDSRAGRRVALACLAVTVLSWGSYTFSQWRTTQVDVQPAVSQQIEVVCDATPAGASYVYRSPEGAPVTCSNGAAARWTLVPQG